MQFLKPGERGVYSFCMCPGGWIVDSSTASVLKNAANGYAVTAASAPAMDGVSNAFNITGSGVFCGSQTWSV